MPNTVLNEIINKMLSENKYSTIKDILKEMNIVDAAQMIENMDEESQVKLFRLLPKSLSADVFSYLAPEAQETIVTSITNKEIHALVEEMFIDDAVDFLEEVPANVVTRVLAQTNPETREIINKFLSYPEDSAGSLMTVEMAAFHEDTTVDEAIESLRKTAQDKETIETCFCIDSHRVLVGSLPLRKLIIAKPGTVIKDIMLNSEKLISVKTNDDRETVAEIVRKYDLLAVPVVDNEERLVGIITIDDVIDVIQEENTEDFEKMALLLPSEDEYLKTGVLTLTKNRIIWLLILMVSATFTGKIIEGFESKLAAIAGLTACIPMLMDTGGNAGNQASTLIIRGLALGSIQIKDYLKVLWKEIRVACICGLTLAAANFLRMQILTRFFHSTATTPVIMIVCISMICAVIIAKTIGCSLPIIAKSLHLDPALMAGPMITTIVDAITLLVYFGFATLFISKGLLPM
ncbi:MAG: magnesium transporter [Clostridiales bacterium]|nr:magnesium transporter [Clostridiales bacterium]